MPAQRRPDDAANRRDAADWRAERIWDKINRAARDVDTYNLERKPLVFAVFGLLAEAARSQPRS